MSEPHARLPIDVLAGPSGFRADVRFGASGADFAALSGPLESAVPEDPIALAYAEGFAAGSAEAQDQAEQSLRDLAEAQAALSLAFKRLDKEMEEELRERLRDTVFALCESAIMPLALDQDGLVRRIELAVSMLARADDERVIRLHPDDIALVSSRLAGDWTITPDPVLERGSVRVETPSGGVEDGPETWRRAIAEALRRC